MEHKDFQDQLDDVRIAHAIRAAEARTSGEIRVFVSRQLCPDPLASARDEFVRLEMTKTPLRNAVLLYFAPRSQSFAIIGDEGIHLRCGPQFWTAVSAELEALLRAGKVTEAVLAGVGRVGEELARHFPRHSGDRDDLPNEVARD